MASGGREAIGSTLPVASGGREAIGSTLPMASGGRETIGSTLPVASGGREAIGSTIPVASGGRKAIGSTLPVASGGEGWRIKGHSLEILCQECRLVFLFFFSSALKDTTESDARDTVGVARCPGRI